jgi:hypothetical protein
MGVSREQFDADQAQEQTELLAYIAAVNAFIALPPVIDLTNEDATVQAGLQAIRDAAAQLPPPPPQPGKPS